MNNGKNIVWLILILFVITVVSCKQNEGNDKESESYKEESNITEENPEAALQKRIENTRHLQVKRKEIIDGMLEGGLASRTENPDGKPYIYVMQPFYLLTLEEQASLMNVTWYYFITDDRSVDVLTIYDEDTGNQIGTFGRKGLLMGGE